MQIRTLSSSQAGGEKESVSTFRIRFTDDLSSIADLWPRTDRVGSAHCYAFQCADIMHIWCKTIGRARGTRALFVSVFDEIERPVLLLPLGIERRYGIRILSFLDGGVSDYNAPVIFEPTRIWQGDILERLWRELIRALPTFDIAIFDKMPADVCGAPNPFVGFGTATAPSGHFLNITLSWDEYAAERLPYKREAIIQRRKLAKIGRVVFTVAETPSDRRRLLDAMLQQKSRRYLETRGVDGLDRPGYRQYYTALVEGLPWPGPLLLSALEVDGKVISTNWGFVSNGRFIGIVMTFEGGEWKRFSAGRLLLEDLLKWNFTNEMAIFDFGVGDESYKVAYTDQTLALYQATIPVTVTGRVYHVGRNTRAWRLFKRIATRAIKTFTG
jgi:CelD/BcsL family acetyltransferase involved in cellulose biosynthesis